MSLFAALSTSPQATGEWILAVLNIVWIDIVLAGDNAVVIALAVRNLPARQRMIGIAAGAGAAVLLRISLTFVATQLLSIRFVQVGGGLMILWIALKLLRENEGPPEDGATGARGLWHAVWMIVVADVTMSLDNVLAVAGASRGRFALLVFGLALSIPMVVFASNLISRLMARFQVVVFIGAAILGKVGGEMILSDPVVAAVARPWWAGVTGATDAAHAYSSLQLGVEVACFAAVFLLGWSRRSPAAAAAD